MAPVSCTLRVDDRTYHLEFQGFEQDLCARLEDGRELRLSPWSLGRHLRALAQAARVEGGELRLDGEALAAEVLGDPRLLGDWGPLALWWAAGGLSEPENAPPEGYVVRRCTWSERAEAVLGNAGEGRLDVAGFVAALVRTCVSAGPGVAPPLSSPRAAALLDALAHENAPRELIPAIFADPVFAASTLALVRATGRTPAEVWSAPAVEMDRVMALMGRPAPRPPAPRPPPRRSGLAAFPDAVLIQVEDD